MQRVRKAFRNWRSPARKEVPGTPRAFPLFLKTAAPLRDSPGAASEGGYIKGLSSSVFRIKEIPAFSAS